MAASSLFWFSSSFIFLRLNLKRCTWFPYFSCCWRNRYLICTAWGSFLYCDSLNFNWVEHWIPILKWFISYFCSFFSCSLILFEIVSRSVDLNSFLSFKNEISIGSKVIHSWIILFLNFVHLLNFLSVPLLNQAFYPASLAGLNSLLILKFLCEDSWLAPFDFLQITVHKIKLSFIMGLMDITPGILTMKTINSAWRWISTSNLGSIFLCGKFSKSVDSKMFISCHHVIMFLFDLGQSRGYLCKLFMMILFFILEEGFKFNLSLFFFLDKIIIFLPSNRLLFEFKVIHSIFKHSLQHLFIN